MRTLFLALALLAACSDSSPPPARFASLNGRLTAVGGSPLRAAPDPDREPNDDWTCAAPGVAAPTGRLDAKHDAVDSYRYVARAAGTVRARVEGHGAVLLHDLESGVAAPVLDVVAGSVYDVVVFAEEGAGGYRVLFDAAGPGGALPWRYRRRGDGHVPGEIVVAPAAGIAPAELGYEALDRGSRICRLRAHAAAGSDVERDLCRLLAECARLAAGGGVRYAEPNYLRRLAIAPDDARFTEQWALAQVRAPAAWEHTTGASSPVVAVVDSGIRPEHPELVGRLLPGYDFEGEDDDPTDPTAGFSHGTATAGIVAASANDGAGVAGMLWNGRVLPVRAFDTRGFGSTAGIANAILFAAGLANSSGTLPGEPARVINLSFASQTMSAAERDACDAAHAAGAFLVAAAGNSSSSGVRYPAGYDSVVAVAATARDGGPASYSNFGSWIDLTAPGGESDDGVLVLGPGSGHRAVDGTSFATPHVAGAAALSLGLAARTPDEMRTLVTGTARDLEPAGFDPATGFGLLDSYRIVLATLGLEPPPVIPGEVVEVRLLRWPSLELVASASTTEAAGLVWSLAPVGPGQYRLEAGTDRDFDGAIDDPGEIHGRWTGSAGGDVLTIAPGAVAAGLDFALTPR